MSVNTEEQFAEHLAKGRWHISREYQFLGGMLVSDYCRLLLSARWVPNLSYLPRVLYLLFQSTCTSIYAILERWRYGSAVRAAKLPYEPLFIIGHFRSGTTMLHHLLALDPRNAAPTLRSCYHPHTFLLAEGSLEERESLARQGDGQRPRNWWEEQRQDAGTGTWTRPMDAVKESKYTPWEDEYAISLLTGGLSTYCGQGVFGTAASAAFDRFLLCGSSVARPSDMETEGDEAVGSRLPAILEPASWHTAAEEEEWTRAVEEFVKKQVVRHGAAKRLVFKSPTHTGKVKVLQRLFPDAKFIFMHRHPLDVLKSSERTYMQLLPYRQLEQPTSLETVHTWLIRQYDRLHWPFLAHSRQALLESDNSLTDGHNGVDKKGSLAELGFNTLVADPVAAIRQLYDALGMEWTEEYEGCLVEYVREELVGVRPGTPQSRRGDDSGLLARALAESVTLPKIAEQYGYDLI